MKNSFFGFRFVQIGFAVALVLGSSAATFAQSYPQRSIKIVLPFAAGGGADVAARVIVPQLHEALGQPVIIENVTGAGGSTGAARAAQSPADGYTLFIGTPSTHGTNVAVYPKLPYDATKDFVPVGLISTSPLMLVVTPGINVNSLSELIKLAKSKPGELTYGSFGTGSINHLATELFESMAGINANHIPYRGSAPALTDLVAGRIQFAIEGPAAMGFIRGDKIKLVAVGSPNRWGFFPDKPTMAEAGVPGYEALTWFGLFAPAGTPKPVIELLNKKLNAVLSSDKTKEAFKKLSIDPAPGAPSVLAKTVDNEIKKWVKVATEKNIKINP